MIDASTQAVVADLVRRQGRSLLQYIRDAYPWTKAEEQQALEKVQALIQEEEEATGALMRFLYKRHAAPPALGSYPGSFTTINFISFHHLVPLLLEYERRGIADLEKQLPLVQDSEARHLLHGMLEMKHRHLHVLKHLDEKDEEKPVEAAAGHH